MNFISLSFAYRCPKRVLEVANRWNQIKYRLSGGKGDKYESHQMQFRADSSLPDGEVRLYSTKDDDIALIRRQYQDDPDFAVVADDGFRGEAQGRFGTPNVFTPEEIGGLGFATVLYYRPLDNLEFKEANRALRKITDSADMITGRAKAGRSDARFVRAFQKVLTGFTRASARLFVMQDGGHDCDMLLNPLAEIINRQVPGAAASSSSQTLPAEDAAKPSWAEREERYRAMGLTQQADDIVQRGLVP
ncbi:hypothetical protein, partial [Legionella sp. CNM-4043-24]|uniref:hypothetical protein n=1 Tax=Legionella sp. CNM-4043-24 TaxID=3421646 RepID=UPI00403AE97F